MFGFKSLMAKMLFDEVLSAVLNLKIGIIMNKSYKQLVSLAVYSLARVLEF